MKSDKIRSKSLDEMIDIHIGEVGTEKREAFEEELRNLIAKIIFDQSKILMAKLQTHAAEG